MTTSRGLMESRGLAPGFRSTGQQLGRPLRHGGHVSPPEWAAPPIRAKGQSRGKEARRKEVSRERPTIVTAIAALFLLSAVHLLIVGLTMLARPGCLSMAAGADLLSGLETAGPYMFLVVSAAGIAVGCGLLRLQNWARRISALLALIVIVLLVPRVSSAVVAARGAALAWCWLGIIIRVVIVFSLYQTPVREIFETK